MTESVVICPGCGAEAPEWQFGRFWTPDARHVPVRHCPTCRVYFAPLPPRGELAALVAEGLTSATLDASGVRELVEVIRAIVGESAGS